MKSSSFLTVLILVVTVLGQQTGTGKAQLSLAKTRGALLLNVGNGSWETVTNSKETQLRPLDRGDHLLITAFLQKVKFPASAEECRAKWWPMTEKSAPMKRENLCRILSRTIRSESLKMLSAVPLSGTSMRSSNWKEGSIKTHTPTPFNRTSGLPW